MKTKANPPIKNKIIPAMTELVLLSGEKENKLPRNMPTPRRMRFSYHV
jgi:hypothetical protein